MGIRKINSRAPTRIDLAGGTLDLWPIYLFLDHPTTLNLGINLFAEADIEIFPGTGHFTLCSEDQKIENKYTWKSLSQDFSKASIPPQLELHWKLLHHFVHQQVKSWSPDFDLKVTTRAKSPAGAGLGGSSALAIALIGALATWSTGRTIDPESQGEEFIEIVRDIETTVIKVPAGIQDYYGAMFGGLQSLHWGFGSHQREWLSDAALNSLSERLVLFYSGQSRNSGINNWLLYKGFVDNQRDIKDKFIQINEATHALDVALRKQDWNGAGEAIRQEWNVRRTLAQGISSPEIDAAFSAAIQIAPISGKICGAGGGGCFFFYLPSADAAMKTQLIERVSKLPGIRHLPFESVRRGLDVQVVHA